EKDLCIHAIRPCSAAALVESEDSAESVGGAAEILVVQARDHSGPRRRAVDNHTSLSTWEFGTRPNGSRLGRAAGKIVANRAEAESYDAEHYTAVVHRTHDRVQR